MTATVPASITDALSLAHASWRPILLRGLRRDGGRSAYLPALAADDYLPTQGRLFAAFTLPLAQVRHVLVGEGPYPRADSATGVCFMDGAVGSLWSATGLSKPVNRATSLRNFIDAAGGRWPIAGWRHVRRGHGARGGRRAASRQRRDQTLTCSAR